MLDILLSECYTTTSRFEKEGKRKTPKLDLPTAWRRTKKNSTKKLEGFDGSSSTISAGSRSFYRSQQAEDDVYLYDNPSVWLPCLMSQMNQGHIPPSLPYAQERSWTRFHYIKALCKRRDNIPSTVVDILTWWQPVSWWCLGWAQQHIAVALTPPGTQKMV